MAKRKTKKTTADSPKPTKAKPKKKSAVVGKAAVRKKTVSSKKAADQKTLDRLDREIVEKVNQRAEVALKLHQETDAAISKSSAASRDDLSVTRAVRGNDGPLSERTVRAVVREVISGTRELEKVDRVAFLGPNFSYSHLASIHRFGQSVDFLPVGTIGSVFDEVHRGQADYGLVPVNNSTDGRIADTLENFTRFDVKICGEVNLQIHHNLLGVCKRSEVQEVYSRPQALSQCRKWLATHLPDARTIEVTSTTAAAKLARDKKGAAAVASVQAGTNYGLDVLAADIEDNPDNLTRFAVIGSESAPRTGNDKTSLMLQVHHGPGSLADALMVFKRNRLNMSWIESFPLTGSRGEYLFFIEMEGHEADLKMRRALKSLAAKTVQLNVLGSYARTEPVD